MTEDQLTEARVFAVAAPVILPLIARRKQVAYERLLSNFRSGVLENTTLIAELSTLEGLERDIKDKEAILTRTMEKKK